MTSFSPDSLGFLPRDHLDYFSSEQPTVGFNGYIRLLTNNESEDLLTWNENSNWKFAWGNLNLDKYFIFGNDAFGGQFAYKTTGEGLVDEKVYLLSKIGLEEAYVFSSFSDFLDRFFLKYLNDCEDGEWIRARDICGTIERHKMFVQVPPEIIIGTFEPSRLVKMEARKAMTLNGDLASQLLVNEHPGEIKGLDAYIDAKGRERLKVVFG